MKASLDEGTPTQSERSVNKLQKKKQKKDRKKRKKHERPAQKLLHLAARNDFLKLKKLLNKHSKLDINAYEATGLTALHQAAKYGHDETVEALISFGADVKAEDFRGNTAAHLAAFNKHTSTVTVLMQAAERPAMYVANQDGITLQAAIQSLIESRVSEPNEATAREEWGSGASSSDDDWKHMGREDGLAAADYASDDPADDFGVYGQPNDAFQFEPGGAQDEDFYAQQMWEEMNRRRHGPSRPSAFAAEFWGKADGVNEERKRARLEREETLDSAAKRRKAAADQAKENSRRILDEEEAKDRAWRQAVLQGDLGARRASYEARWHVFATSSDPITYAKVPWLVDDKEDAGAIVLYGTNGASERRKRLRFELMRWHPDKFQAKFGARITAPDRASVFDRVNTISQMLNSISK